MKNNWINNYLSDIKCEEYFHAFNILLLVIGMVFSPFLITVGLCSSVLGIIVRLFQWKESIKRLSQSWKIILCISIVFLLDIFGIFFSNNKTEAFNVIVHQIPLFIIPIYICLISPIKKKIFDFLILIYILSMLFGTIWGFVVYLRNDYADVRKLVIGARNIAFAMKTAFAIIILLIYAYKTKKHKKKIIVLSLCFFIFLIITQMISGLLSLVFITLVFSLIIIFRKLKSLSKRQTIIYRSFAWGFVIFICLSCLWIVGQYNNYFVAKDTTPLSANNKTLSGNVYTHAQDDFIENGYYVNNFVCEKEVEEEWEKIYNKSLDDTCEYSPYTYRSVIFRYMNSKGLHKDKEGVRALNEKDFDNINHGYANVVYAERFSLKPRLYQTFFEFERFEKTGNVSEMSLIQRYVCLKNACKLIAQNFWFGVGTGDEKEVIDKTLREKYTVVEIEDSDPHNQFIYEWVGFGIIGLCLMIVALVYLPTKLKLWKNIYFISFFVISICYMFSESALRMVAGMIFYALFLSLIAFNKKNL
ncbi:MAG: O-antigen ligase family protein [Bacteroidales bacterium]|nr:O-antigen ligase family protein [Bacteroidales bacterium]